jgi:hypothetical protein
LTNKAPIWLSEKIFAASLSVASELIVKILPILPFDDSTLDNFITPPLLKSPYLKLYY